MIIPMKRLELLLYHQEQAEFLDSLGNAGVVHITKNEEAISEKSESLRDELVAIDKVISSLSRIEPKKGDAGEPKKIITDFQSTTNRLEIIANDISALEKDIVQLKPWGDFNPETLLKLESSDVYISFYELKGKEKALLDGYDFEIISKSGDTERVALITRDKPAQLGKLEPSILPEISLNEVNKEIAILKDEQSNLQSQEQIMAGSITAIKEFRESIEQDFLLEQAKLSMDGVAQNYLLHLTGWFPEEIENEVTAVLNNFSCWYETTKPTREDSVPVKMKNMPGAKLFEPITKIFALPDYFEIDPTMFFAPFYALFFGLCLGDVGYGLTLILLSLIGMKVMPKIKGIMYLGMILGGFTMLSGVLLNTIFGAQLFEVAGSEQFGFLSAGSNGFALLKPVVINGITVFPAMAFAVLIGMFQIIFGLFLKSFNKFKEGGLTYTLYPIGSILLVASATIALVKINFLDMATFFPILFGANLDSIVGQRDAIIEAIPAMAMQIPMIIGLVLLFLFNNPDKKMGIRLPLGLWELYGFVTGLMGDALSYIRLFALGLAGGLLGKAFNDIGFMMVADSPEGVPAPAFMFVFTVLILILGHTINFALAALGSFVHPLRLTFVEFYKNLEFKGGAEGYKPFSKAKVKNN